MSTITREDVLRLAELARLNLSDDEIEKYQKELSSIIGYVEMLKNADTEGLEPTYQVTGLVNVVRPDEVINYGATPSELLKNAPDQERNLFKVKRMVG